MQKIKIENFGTVTEFEAVLNEKLTVLIGPQASGKSTISKLIFFCRSIKEDLFKFVLTEERIVGKTVNQLFTDFLKELSKEFVGYFGTTKHMKKFLVSFEYDYKVTSVNATKYVNLTLKDGYAKVIFSEDLKNAIFLVLKEIQGIYESSKEFEKSSKSLFNIALWQSHQESLSDKIENEINTLFSDDCYPIFIPAGRSVVGTLSEHFHSFIPENIDRLMKDFIERIYLLKKRFSQRLDEIVEDKKKYSSDKIFFKKVDLAIDKIKGVLRGDYVYDKDGEKIFFNENEYVKLMYASSGQQESLWILLLLFTMILDNHNVFLVIEEPEAHLFPNAQKLVLELITLLTNSSKSDVIITTHSPYILTSINLLIHSGMVESQLEGKGEKIIVEKEFRIKKGNLRAYMLNNTNKFSSEDITGKNTGKIRAEKIDEVSELINEKIDALLDLEVKYEM